MGEIALRNEEKVGLLAALVLHGALVTVLLMQTVRSEVAVFPDRMTVSLATEVGLEAQSPDPVAESRAAIAPTLAEDPAPAPEAAKPAPPTRVQPAPPPKPVTRTATQQPAPTRDRSRPDRTAPKPAATPAKAAAKGGGSRIGDDFLEGKGSSTTTTETRAPAAKFGAQEAADLRSAITRQIKRNWTAPNGVEAELLVSVVSWKLNPDGTLKGRPTCRTNPSSITEANRPQAALHCERAIRAVQLADFSKLPDQFYSRWDDLEWQFDRRL
ncbi:MAG: energy transducer TonB [Erythrobacter sp.]|jgi:protein TonB|uniref:energy transducer TonB n=1 Tax=Erythrobacter sp. TaxID=1042 RepID=UPI002B48AF06|nr:energy transducer TonB [Erythrobacter sp.]WRH70120.1 MAG: energy transducer TonB [Erythrobacter sp.]